LDAKTQIANRKWPTENFKQTTIVNCKKISHFFLYLFHHAELAKFDNFVAENLSVRKSSTRSIGYKYSIFKCFLNGNVIILMKEFMEYWIGAAGTRDSKSQAIYSE
jgi:hypothetical protein